MNIDKYNKKVVTDILIRSFEKKASDIHFSIGNYIGYRINGQIEKQKDFDILNKKDTVEIFNVIKSFVGEENQAFIEYELKEKKHSGFSISLGEEYRFRVNVAKNNGGYYIVLRSLTAKPMNLNELGFSDKIYNALISISKKKAGLFLVVGPTGSGKSTTLSSILLEINKNYPKNIITLEDPIEYIHSQLESNIVQKELGRDFVSFSEGLHSALREDPDVILVGEIRDEKTLNLALKAAETGHLVLSTLHTDNTVSTIQRMVAMSDNEKLTRDRLSSTLLGVISQRLEPIKSLSKEEAIKLNLKPRNGRIIVYEMLTFNPALLNMVKEENDLQIRSNIDNIGHSQSYNETLINYIKDKTLTSTEALRLTDNKDDLMYRIESKIK